MKKRVGFWLAALLVLLLGACARPRSSAPTPTAEPSLQPPMKNLSDIVADDARLATLAEAFRATGLIETLQGDDHHTLFAPTDDAFAALPGGTLDSLMADADTLSEVLLSHMLEGKVMAADLLSMNGQETETLSGQPLLVASDGQTVEVSGSSVITADVEASNGVIHVISTVLLPPSVAAMTGEETRSIADIVVEDSQFIGLALALEEAGLLETLKSDGPYTLFAPTHEAFVKLVPSLPDGAVDSLLRDVDSLTSILLYHLVKGRVTKTDALGLDGQEVETLSGESFLITIEDDDTVRANEATVIVADIGASNGVIHAIDTLLLPPSAEEAVRSAEMNEKRSILDLVAEDERLTTMSAALQAAGLGETLEGHEPYYTLLAPSDDAFAALPDGVLGELMADTDTLSNVLLYHVLEGAVLAADLQDLDGEAVDTLLGQTVLITVNGDTTKINDASLIITDIEASDGVMHVIDTVLLPQIAETRCCPGAGGPGSARWPWVTH